jgi:PRTRC genetic system ThiF family protein
MKHNITTQLLSRTVSVSVVGTGGNGSIVAMALPYIHQALLVAGHPGGLDVTLIDGDVVSESNCIRQPFSRSEIGLPKATVLVSRINLFWNLNWRSAPQRLADDHLLSDSDIVIGCVDTREARAGIETRIVGTRSRVAYWLDLGNGAEGGQFVLGQPLNARNPRKADRLRTVAELFPEIVNPALDDNTMPSCSALESLERQEPFVNQTLSSHAMAMLARLFRYGGLEHHHGAFVNIASQSVQPLLIDPVGWKRLMRRGRSTKG